MTFYKKHNNAIFSASILALVLLFLITLTTLQEDGGGSGRTYDATPTETPAPDPTDTIDIVFVDGLPTAVLSGTTPTQTPTQALTPEPTEAPTNAPTATNTPVPTRKPTRTPTPTKKPTETPKTRYSTVDAGTRAVPQGGHAWKPYARHTAITAKSSPQYKLQQIAKTDSNGLRYVMDAEGVKRYCVALPVKWAGGTAEDIGRCFDVVMKNGATLHCVLGDIKKIEHSQNGAGLFGANGELLEFQADQAKLPEIVRKSGDVSRLGGEFEGEAVEITVYDKNVLHVN